MPGALMTDAPPAPAAEDVPMPGGGQDAHPNLRLRVPRGCLGGPSFLPPDPCCECEE